MRQLVISGPTGSGKSDLAHELSQRLTVALANADAFQFYKEIPVLSNQPSFDMRFLAFRSLTEVLSAGEFGRMTLPTLQEAQIWVGTGLYLGAVLYGLDVERKKGTPFQKDPRVDFKMIVLNPERSELYDALNERVDRMIEHGAFEEAEKIYFLLESKQINKTNPVLKAIGLRHLLQYFCGELKKNEALETWKRDSRRLAKRQWTWLRKFCSPSTHILWTSSNASKQSLLEFFESD